VADLRPDARSSLTQIAARLAAASTVVGAGLVVASVVATRRLWFGGYVSEAGVAAEPQASTYRWGILGLALGLLLLAVALVRVLPLTAVLLAGSGLQFEDRGLHTFRGIPDQWQLFAARA